MTPPLHGACRPNIAQHKIIALAHNTFLKRGAFRPTLSRLLSLFRSGPLDVEYQGVKFRLHYSASATESGALLNSNYNLDELTFLRSNLREGDVFLDIGANVGTVALPIARSVGPKGRVLAIEAHPTALARLEFNRHASKLDNVTVVAVAAADVDGEVTMVSGDENLGASHISSDARMGGITVPALTLATILVQNGVQHIGALKIDVEGFEDRVLTDFYEKTPRSAWPRAVVIEHISRDQWQTDCIALMQASGYRISERTRSNTMLLLDAAPTR
ncbi:MAG: FkbM family methyltransferase [Mesorhizobium sp.]